MTPTLMPLRRVVAATDFSEDAAGAVERARLLAAEHGASLDLVHVINASMLDALKAVFLDRPEMDQALRMASQAALEELAAQAARDGIAATVHLRSGPVVAELASAAAESDVMVLGAHGVNPLRDRILGTTAERLLGRCTAPVIVTRRAPAARYRKVLVAIDLSPCSGPVLAAAARLARQASIHVFHVYEVPYEGKLWLAGVAEAHIERYRAEVRGQALVQLDALIEAHLPERSNVALTVERGSAAMTILDAAAQYEADLVVLGKQGLSAVGDYLLGSVTRHVVADAECDVMVVPPAARLD